MPRINIYLARHGETLFNRKEYIQGQSDAPLTQDGIDGAKNLGKELQDIEFDLAITSNLGRAVETNRIILKHNKKDTPVEVHKDFGELDFGEYEGDSGYMFWELLGQRMNLNFDEIGRRSLFEKYDYLYHPTNNPTAERANDFKKRITDAINALITRAKEENLKNILVVSHGVVVNGLIEIFDEDYEFDGFIANSSVTKLVHEKDHYTFEYVGQRENL